MKECLICKTANPDNSKFCSVCGTRFPEITADESIYERNQHKSDSQGSIYSAPKYEYMTIAKYDIRNRIEAEYKDEYAKTNNSWEQQRLFVKYLPEQLNKLGEEGWDLILYDDKDYCYLFKRAKVMK